MPAGPNRQPAGEIKQLYPETIILLNTAYAEFEFARRAVEYQLDAYLLKPAAEELILRTIEECLRKKTGCHRQPPRLHGGTGQGF